MEQLSIIDRIFQEFFRNLKDNVNLNGAIINKLQEIYNQEGFSEASLDKFVRWLEEYDAKDKES